MKDIILANGAKTKVDDDAFDYLNQWKWHEKKSTYTSYAYTRTAEGETIYIHQLVIKIEAGYRVDHIDRDGLNNQRENLRQANHKQNALNAKRKNKNGYKGVHKNHKRWMAQIWNGEKMITLGNFDTPEEAARIYDAKALQMHGEFACLNFPA